MDVTIEAALVGAGASLAVSLATQVLTGYSQTRREQREFARTDEGVRRQVVALMQQVGTCVCLARRNGPTDWKKMGGFLNRLQSRIYLWEVSTALTNAQSAALYYAAGLIEITYDEAMKKMPSDHSTHDIMEMFKESCVALASFWSAMGDTKRSEHFASISLPIVPD